MDYYKNEIKSMIDKFEDSKTIEMLFFLIRKVLKKEENLKA